MLAQYNLVLSVSESKWLPRSEWGYWLYAALLEKASKSFGSRVHEDAVTPISQFLTIKDNNLYWRVTLLGKESQAALGDVIHTIDALYLRHEKLRLPIEKRTVKKVAMPDSFFLVGETRGGAHSFRFHTVTAFKHQGKYVTLPTPRLLLQSLMKKWNGSFPDCPIEDADGHGLDAMAAGLRFRDFQLRSGAFRLKGAVIPGFVGAITVENQLDGFHRKLADALLLFAPFAGIGIKTALGMGGVERL